MRIVVFIIAVWISGFAAALAQQAPVALSAPKVGAASVVVAPPSPARRGLYVSNPNASVTLWVSPTGTSAVVNGAGSIAIQPLQGVMFGPPNTPSWSNGMNAVATSGSNNAISILEY
jgi:hypothetical protein